MPQPGRDQQMSQPGAAGTTGQPAQREPAVQPGTADQKMQTGQPERARPQAAQRRISDRELRQHARAHAILAQKAPELYAKVEQSKNPAADITGEDRKKLEEALKETGISFREFARVHRAIATDKQVAARFQRLEQQVKAQPTGPAPGASGAGRQPAQPAP
ncbi:MAG TPA: hypothetical protein VNM66_01360, partial [Thermodesulfobacteriota bacterium]|nr:hypothetical protein [Thermodesulfobacteriota bacterium]